MAGRASARPRRTRDVADPRRARGSRERPALWQPDGRQRRLGAAIAEPLCTGLQAPRPVDGPHARAVGRAFPGAGARRADIAAAVKRAWNSGRPDFKLDAWLKAQGGSRSLPAAAAWSAASC